ncbi:TAXI family TRAP transporter solute-binding subunit [Desulfoluna spongiiphila]|uniref:TRAP transporter solute receptor, TAXI family n=1 Tax=Desulfoluna spongiiphila TaxID=419481 RepID=A0A1G5GHY2_9BACT|nr:TAXI family TRAP transporter solute-binding subunit [Desulfoluna spongiiphila]SCY51145.1 hypothetical protein SAMN05216233_110180 [Desulfoluna spongiiphila]VVS93542.1 prokaryotic membrane lipoprotein lipid attachment site profile [Desulfoluna spongiiphila]
MNRWLFLSMVVLFTVAIGCSQPSDKETTDTRKKITFVTIGTGDITGVYYPTGGAIAKIVNKKREAYGIRTTVEATIGSVYNVNAIMTGDLEFGIVQSDRQYQAINGMKEWDGDPQADLRAVFSIHPESVTLLAAVDADIKTISDLKGKRVNIGNPGSGQRGNAIDALEAAGINWQTDIKAKSVEAAKAPGLLLDKEIDAFFYTVGHPSSAFKEATSGHRPTRFVAITETGELIRKFPYYAKSYIPAGLYPGAANEEDNPTFGVKATFCTSAKMPDEVVYAITKEVFENFEEFKRLHPAYQVITKKSMLEGLSAPLHPGAVRYYKEAGLM